MADVELAELVFMGVRQGGAAQQGGGEARRWKSCISDPG
jgi:hypothetical protein